MAKKITITKEDIVADMAEKTVVKLSPSREEFLAKHELVQEIKAQERSRLERWLDKHNHVMELLRTLFALLTLSLQGVILGKLFNLF